MEKHIIDEKTGIPYTLVGDYYLPWGDLPDVEPEQRQSVSGAGGTCSISSGIVGHSTPSSWLQAS